MAKARLASHEFRIGTDAVRQDYRRRRGVELESRLQERRTLAAAIAADAAAEVPRGDGYVVCPPGQVPDIAPAVAAAQRLAADTDVDQLRARALEQQQRKKPNKAYLTALVDMTALTRESPFMQLALRPDIVATAAAYLGMIPILQYVNVWHSRHVDEDPAKSQLYHCDSDEAEQLKMFVLCSDVTRESGPLTFIGASASQEIRDRVEYRYDDKLSDDAMAAAMPMGVRETALTGAPGTVAFLDTSRCFHFGSRFTDRTAQRLVIMLQFVTPLAFVFPEEFVDGATFRGLADPRTDEVTALVLGAS